MVTVPPKPSVAAWRLAGPLPAHVEPKVLQIPHVCTLTWEGRSAIAS
jgi:hypothetical protein